MCFAAILSRWIEILSALYLAWRESGRERRSLIVTRENQHIVVRRAEPSRDAMLRDALVRQDLAALGLPVDRVVARDSDSEATDEVAGSVTLWSRLADTSRASLGGVARTIGIGIAALVTASVVLSLWALASAASIRNESEEMQSYLAQLAGDQRASLVSSGGEATKRDDAPDTIRLQATLDMNLKSLRAVLYQLESGTPYVFVDALAVQPIGATAGRAAEDPLLRTTLSLRAFWRRGAP